MIIYDDFLPLLDSNLIEEILIKSSNFPWYLLDYGTCPEDDLISRPEYAKSDRPQLAHSFFNPEGKSSYVDLVMPLVKELERREKKQYLSRLVRIKANLIMQDKIYGENEFHFPHKDLTKPATSLLYYVNDSDGDTFIFNETDIDEPLTLLNRISPKKNRAVVFNSNKMHASSSPRFSNIRSVISVVFEGNYE